jgi:hypothetical protein
MALLMDPGTFMPKHEDDFAETSWFQTWDTGPFHLHDAEPGGTVYLVDVQAQRIVWKTEVVRMVAVPYEALDGFAAEVQRRWGIHLISVDMNPGGFCIGWMAKPIERLNRGPRTLTERLHRTVQPDENLDLTRWQFGEQLSPAFRYRWGLPEVDPSDQHLCTGRAPLGWFEA